MGQTSHACPLGRAGAAGGADLQLSEEDSASQPQGPVSALLLTRRLWRWGSHSGAPRTPPPGPEATQGGGGGATVSATAAAWAQEPVPVCVAHAPLAAAGCPGEGKSSSHCGGLGPAPGPWGLRSGVTSLSLAFPGRRERSTGARQPACAQRRGAEAAATARPARAVPGPSRSCSTTERVAVPGRRAAGLSAMSPHLTGEGLERRAPPRCRHSPAGPDARTPRAQGGSTGLQVAGGLPAGTPPPPQPLEGQSGRASQSRGLVQEEGPARAEPRGDTGQSHRDTRVQAQLTLGQQGAAENGHRDATGGACGTGSFCHSLRGQQLRAGPLSAASHPPGAMSAGAEDPWGPPGPPRGRSRRHRRAVGTGQPLKACELRPSRPDREPEAGEAVPAGRAAPTLGSLPTRPGE